MTRRSILVTGAAGFIGRYIARHFSERGWSVVGLDAVPAENAPLASLATYYQLALPSAQLSELLQQYIPDACVHCAGRASVGQSMIEPAADFYSGPVLTFEVLNTLRLRAPNCRFIFLSSAAVYGNPDKIPVVETQPTAPISPYGFHKWQNEILCQEFSQIYGVPTASARIFSAYGPGLRRQVVWDICWKALGGGLLVLQGTGQESRDFIHALDIAGAVETILAHAPMQGEVYNVASGREITILELATIILDVLGLPHQPQFDGVVPVGTPRHWRADITKLTALGFNQRVTLESGLKTFAEWCRAELAGV